MVQQIISYFILWVLGLISLYIVFRLASKAVTKSILETLNQYRRESIYAKTQQQQQRQSTISSSKENEKKPTKVNQERQRNYT